MDTEDIETEVWFVVDENYQKLGKAGPLWYNRWIHGCFSIDLATETLTAVSDGIFIFNGVIKGLAHGRPSSLSGRVVLGKRYTDGLWKQDTTMYTNLQVFGRKLSIEEMMSITGTEDCVEEGDYLAWSQMVWHISGPATVWTTVTKEALCSRSTFVRFLPEPEYLSEALR